MAIKTKTKTKRTFDVFADTVDFRDTIYIPTLIAVSAITDIKVFREYKIPVLDQGTEGACTGFGLATVANYLLLARGKNPNAEEVSAWMLYIMAKRYDEWPGEEYEGSSARGAMKGWHKNGLCAKRLWLDRVPDSKLDLKRAADAIQRPLGAYFRVNHKDLVAMHAAISEVGVLFATAFVHEGWQQVRTGDEQIVQRPDRVGGHAFAIVGYTREGFWIQNSWGSGWGSGGLALLSYADWLANGTDVWVAALGAPVHFDESLASASMMSGAPRSYESRIYAQLRPHIVTARNDGILDQKGPYGLTEDGLRNVVAERLPTAIAAWASKRVVLYAHGGLVSEETAIQTVASNLEALLKAQVYPISFIWRSDISSTIRNILTEAFSRRRSESVLDTAKDFMFDRIDDTIEPLARALGGKSLWDEMKENAERATTESKGAARLTADHLVSLHASGKLDEIHLVAHSAGAIFHAFLADYLIGKGVPITSVSLWAPACTLSLFKEKYDPHVKSGKIATFDLYTLDDATEQDDDCAHIYHKSLLCLVSAAFEEKGRISGGTPILGLQRDAKSIPAAFWRARSTNWYKAPGAKSLARHHGDFDDDPKTLLSTLERITGVHVSSATMAAAASIDMRSTGAKRMFVRRLNAALVRGSGF